MSRITRVIIIALATLCALTFTTFAVAQQKMIREELATPQLQKAWDAGKEMREDGNWKGARVQYDAIYRESKNVRVLFNLGVCWKELGYYAQALGAWEKQLANRKKLPEKEATRAEKAIEIIRPLVTTLELTSNQTGAMLSIKGIEIGTTPFLGTVPIDAGTNEIKLEKAGFVTANKTVEVLKGKPIKVTLDMVPSAKLGKVTISITGAPAAMIFMDGRELGRAPYSGEIPEGEHTFEARQKGYVTGVQTTVIEYQDDLKITLAMVESSNEGKLRINVDHEDAVITIDGEVKGSGSWEGVLRAGGHSVEVSKDGWNTYSEDISIDPDEERVKDVVLEQNRTSYWIYWAITGIAVAAGAGVTSYFVLRPAEGAQVSGTLAPGIVPTNVGVTIFSF